jgi:hypothetical protein
MPATFCRQVFEGPFGTLPTLPFQSALTFSTMSPPTCNTLERLLEDRRGKCNSCNGVVESKARRHQRNSGDCRLITI